VQRAAHLRLVRKELEAASTVIPSTCAMFCPRYSISSVAAL